MADCDKQWGPAMRRMLLALAALAATAFPAGAQGLMEFPADNYGKVNKAYTESSQNQAVLEVLMGKTDVFETIWDLAETDIFRRTGRSVGMLDLLVQYPGGRRANATCTATRIAADKLLTNYHCIPGRDIEVIEASVRFGFLDRIEAPGELFRVSLDPVEADRDLDYAVIPILDPVPEAKYPVLRLSPRDAGDRESLFLIHHPAGQPQRLTRIRCQAGRPSRDEAERLVHHCDTLGGSSGTAILAINDRALVGIHHSGVPDPVRPFNLGTPASRLLEASGTLAGLMGAGASPPPPADPPPGARASARPDEPDDDPVSFTAVSDSLTALYRSYTDPCQYREFAESYPEHSLAGVAFLRGQACEEEPVTAPVTAASGEPAAVSRVPSISKTAPADTPQDYSRTVGAGPRPSPAVRGSTTTTSTYPAPRPAEPAGPSVDFGSFRLEQGVPVMTMWGAYPGLGVYLSDGTMSGLNGEAFAIVARFTQPDGSPLHAASWDMVYRDPNGEVISGVVDYARQPLIPLEGTALFIPYANLNFAPSGYQTTINAAVQVEIWIDGEIAYTSPRQTFSFLW